MYIGAFLMLAELLMPGFVIFFFGLSAATVALIRFALGDSFTLMWQLAAFSFFAILYLALLRRLMKRLFTGDTETSPVDFGKESVGRIGRVVEAIEPPKSGWQTSASSRRRTSRCAWSRSERGGKRGFRWTRQQFSKS